MRNHNKYDASKNRNLQRETAFSWTALSLDPLFPEPPFAGQPKMSFFVFALSRPACRGLLVGIVAVSAHVGSLASCCEDAGGYPTGRQAGTR